MTFDQFVGQVQHKARLGSTGASVRAIQATLQTLGERLDGGEAKDLAAQLPREFAIYMQQPEHGVRMSLDEFFKKVSEREQENLPDSVYHARVVMEVLQEAVSDGEIADVQAQLPSEWAPLFAGSEGNLRMAGTAKRA